MPYSFDDIQKRILTGEFASLGLEAIALYADANRLFEYDPDLPAMVSSLVANGAIPPLHREQVQCLIALFLAIEARMENPHPFGSPLEQTNLPGSSVEEVPDAFRQALNGLDLENL